MPLATALKLLTLLRLVAFTVSVYLLFGLVVERTCAPRGPLAAFARLVCSPIARPVARILAPGASERRVLAVSLAIVGAAWAALVALDTMLH